MKISQYIYYLDKKDKVICYSTLYDKIVLISQKAYASIKESLEMCKDRFPKTYDSLVANGFIIPDEIDELDVIRSRNKMAAFQSRAFDLTLLPSLDCNLRCWYCYEDHVRNSRMGREVQDSVVKMVRNKIEKDEIDGLSLNFYGGEPLLDFEDIAYPVSIALKTLCEEANIPFNTFFTTNGTLIDDGMLDKLAGLNAGFQITLDGYEEKHDKIRFRKSNQEGTYRHIINTIRKITDCMEHVFVNIRINYDEQTFRNIDGLLEDLSGIDRSKVNVHFERVWQTEIVPDNENLKRTVYLFMQNGFKTTYANWHPRGFACKAECLNQLVVSYDGKVYKCTGRNFTDEHCDGVLGSDGEVRWKPGRLERRLGKATFENPMCLACKMLPLCMGPCSQKQIDVGQDCLHQVCSKNVLEMRMGDYIEYYCNNLFVSNRSEETKKCDC